VGGGILISLNEEKDDHGTGRQGRRAFAAYIVYVPPIGFV
jgi:hypothetical protein